MYSAISAAYCAAVIPWSSPNVWPVGLSEYGTATGMTPRVIITKPHAVNFRSDLNIDALPFRQEELARQMDKCELNHSFGAQSRRDLNFSVKDRRIPMTFSVPCDEELPAVTRLRCSLVDLTYSSSVSILASMHQPSQMLVVSSRIMSPQFLVSRCPLPSLALRYLKNF